MTSRFLAILAAFCVAFVVFCASAETRASDPQRPVPPRKPAAAPARPALPIAEPCAWLGKRTVSLLARDDVHTAAAFDGFYRRFDCPAPHLKAALSCAVSALGGEMPESESLAKLVESCWKTPSLRFLPTPPEGSASPR